MELTLLFTLFAPTFIFLIDPSSGDVYYPNCGAEKATCVIECNAYNIQNSYRSYYPTFPACILTNLNYQAVSNDQLTEIDLSNRNLALNHLIDSIYGLNYWKVKKINMSGNVFHWYGSQASLNRNHKGLPAFVNQFSNLTSLDLSNITAAGFVTYNWGRTYTYLENLWFNNLALKHLDVSDNRNLLYSSDETFAKMVNLRTLRMSHCCTIISGNAFMFRDLNNLEYLDISGNSWPSPARSALYPMVKLKYLDISRTNATFDPSTFFEPLSNLETVFLENVNQQDLNVSILNFSSEKIRQLSLRGNRLSGLVERENLFGLKNSSALEYLDLSDVEISPSQTKENSSLLQCFENLQFLNISGSKSLLRNLNSSISRHKNKLERLDMSRMELLETNCGNDTNLFENMHNLKELILRSSTFLKTEGDNCITSRSEDNNKLFHSLGKLDKLQHVDLSFTKNFPVQMNSTSLKVSFPELRHLNLSRGSFPFIEISGIEKLESLDLSGVHVEKVKLSGLHNVKFLNFSSHLTYLDELNIDTPETNIEVLDLSDLQNLTWIDISNIKVNRIMFHNLPKLEHVYFQKTCPLIKSLENGSWEFPALLNAAQVLRNGTMEISLSNLTSLRNLNLSNHQCSIDKIDVRHSSNLEVINFFNVSIDRINLQNLDSLISVNLSRSTNMDLALKDLPNLEDIDLSNSKLEQIKVSNVSKLDTLDMSFTDGEKLIPRLKIDQFKNLAQLNLSYCNLFWIPANLSALEELRSLDLSHNFLYSITDMFLPPVGKCKLVNLDLSHNFIQVIPSEFITPMVDPFIRWSIDLNYNLLNCSDCQNLWMSLESFSANIEGALCQTPFEKYHEKVQDTEICSEEK